MILLVSDHLQLGRKDMYSVTRCVRKIKVDERAEQVETIGCRERDHDIAQRRLGLNGLSKATPNKSIATP